LDPQLARNNPNVSANANTPPKTKTLFFINFPFALYVFARLIYSRIQRIRSFIAANGGVKYGFSAIQAAV
jgi:hypothetical protein